MDGYLEGSDNIAVEKYFDGPDSNNALTDFWSDKNGVDNGNQDRDRITEMVEQADSSMRAYLRSSECNGATEDNFGDRDGTDTGNIEQENDVNAEKRAGDIAMWGNKKRDVVIHWFRRGLRLHDNPALLESLANASTIYFVYLLDPWFAGSSQASIVKWRFLLQCLDDLDSNLRKLNTRLYVIRGQAANVFPKLFKEWNVTLLSFEEDPEPYGKERDVAVCSLAQDDGVDVIMKTSHTLYDMKSITDLNGGNAPLTYRKFQKLLARCGPPAEPVATVTREMLEGVHTPVAENHDEQYGVPLLEELGFETSGVAPAIWHGGETEAVARLDRHLERTAWVANFERPKMTAQSLLPSQTCLTAYLRFGCLSARLFYWRLVTLYRQVKQRPDPPISLHGQLMWREFFYIAASKNPNFDRMIGNPICVQIPWDHDPEALAKWAEGKTGFPWIDAIMTQLKQNGWIHPLARHAVACFLTRGDLWISWEEGAKVFEELLLDADWSVNAGMWLWLSCSSFFQPFLNAYCPVEFGKHIDPSGDYIRKYLPVLKGFSSTYIYEPWTAPEHVQKRARCIIGVDYPLPMVNHAEASQMNVERMKLVYQHLCMELGRQGSLTNLLSGNGKDLVSQLLGPNSGLAFKKKSESEST